jgi:DNA-binding NarL/FixJ family response regulator
MKAKESKNPDIISIAVVEDDKTIREGLVLFLQGSPGLLCVAAYENGEEAIAGLREMQSDVVLMDVKLPGISGIECILKLKALNLPMLFIILTVFDDDELIFKSLAAGASGYLTKQTSPSKLLEAIYEVYSGGSPMSNEIARKVVQSFQQQGPFINSQNGLSKREEEILAYLARGYLYKEIAELLFISVDTVRSHIRHIYEKLQVKTRTQATLLYLRK